MTSALSLASEGSVGRVDRDPTEPSALGGAWGKGGSLFSPGTWGPRRRFGGTGLSIGKEKSHRSDRWLCVHPPLCRVPIRFEPVRSGGSLLSGSALPEGYRIPY